VRSDFAAPSTYATHPTDFFSCGLVLAIIAASSPMPPITTNARSSWVASSRRIAAKPTSIAAVSPSKVARIIFSRSSRGRRRFRASRLPVPLGTIVSGTPVPHIASDTARTVPSPPATSTASAPSSIAVRATPSPRSSGVVSKNSGAPQPAFADARSTEARITSAATLVGLYTRAARRGGSGSPAWSESVAMGTE